MEVQCNSPLQFLQTSLSVVLVFFHILQYYLLQELVILDILHASLMLIRYNLVRQLFLKIHYKLESKRNLEPNYFQSPNQT